MDVDSFSTIPAQESPFETNIPKTAWNQLSRLSPANVIRMCFGWFSLEMEDNVCTIIFLWLKCLVDETMKHRTASENDSNARFQITFCGSSVSAKWNLYIKHNTHTHTHTHTHTLSTTELICFLSKYLGLRFSPSPQTLLREDKRWTPQECQTLHSTFKNC